MLRRREARPLPPCADPDLSRGDRSGVGRGQRVRYCRPDHRFDPSLGSTTPRTYSAEALWANRPSAAAVWIDRRSSRRTPRVRWKRSRTRLCFFRRCARRLGPYRPHPPIRWPRLPSEFLRRSESPPGEHRRSGSPPGEHRRSESPPGEHRLPLPPRPPPGRHDSDRRWRSTRSRLPCPRPMIPSRWRCRRSPRRCWPDARSAPVRRDRPGP
jgi:hypothetical protein